MPARSIRMRMTVVFSLSIAVLMAIVCSGLIVYTRHTTERNADRLLGIDARKLSAECVGPDGSIDMDRLMEEEREDLRPESISVAVIDHEGTIIGSSVNASRARLLVQGEGWRTARLSAGLDTLIVGMPWRHVQDGFEYGAMVLLLLSTFVTALAAVGAWVLVGRTLSPIAMLSHEADSSSADSLHVCLREPSADAEIVGLVATLNGLLTRLSDTAKAKGRFYSAASHELRTPLQALSGHLELALTRERTTEEYKRVVGEAYAQTRRLIMLVRNLLLLYQLDSPTARPVPESGDLASICRQALVQYQSLIEERRLQIGFAVEDGTTFTALPTHMDILVRNLVENAVKYAVPGTEITLEVTRCSGTAQLRITNRCASDLGWNEDRLFEPFGRLDASRNSHAGGTGLGLAICRAIATANQWNLYLRQQSGVVCAILTLPCPPPDHSALLMADSYLTSPCGR